MYRDLVGYWDDPPPLRPAAAGANGQAPLTARSVLARVGRALARRRG